MFHLFSLGLCETPSPTSHPRQQLFVFMLFVLFSTTILTQKYFRNWYSILMIYLFMPKIQNSSNSWSSITLLIINGLVFSHCFPPPIFKMLMPCIDFPIWDLESKHLFSEEERELFSFFYGIALCPLISVERNIILTISTLPIQYQNMSLYSFLSSFMLLNRVLNCIHMFSESPKSWRHLIVPVAVAEMWSFYSIFELVMILYRPVS